MQAKITGAVFLLMVLSMAATSKSICGKKLQHPFTPAPAMVSIPGTGAGLHEEAEKVGVLPVNLFLFS
jgi:hypothetical protein